MAMTAAQINAFKTASGNIDISVLYLVSLPDLSYRLTYHDVC